MIWAITAHAVPFMLAVVAGWFLREWWEWRRIAKAAEKVAEEFRTDIHWGL